MIAWFSTCVSRVSPGSTNRWPSFVTSATKRTIQIATILLSSLGELQVICLGFVGSATRETDAWINYNILCKRIYVAVVVRNTREEQVTSNQGDKSSNCQIEVHALDTSTRYMKSKNTILLTSTKQSSQEEEDGVASPNKTKGTIMNIEMKMHTSA